MVQHTPSRKPRPPDAGPDFARPDQSRRPADDAPRREQFVPTTPAFLADTRLSFGEKMVLLALQTWDWPDPQGTDRFHPSNERIARAIGLGTATSKKGTTSRQVRNLLKSLEAKGFLEIAEGQPNATHRVIYRREPGPAAGLSVARPDAPSPTPRTPVHPPEAPSTLQDPSGPPLQKSSGSPCKKVQGHPATSFTGTPAGFFTHLRSLSLDQDLDSSLRPPDGGRNDPDSLNDNDAGGGRGPTPRTGPPNDPDGGRASKDGGPGKGSEPGKLGRPGEKAPRSRPEPEREPDPADILALPAALTTRIAGRAGDDARPPTIAEEIRKADAEYDRQIRVIAARRGAGAVPAVARPEFVIRTPPEPEPEPPTPDRAARTCQLFAEVLATVTAERPRTSQHGEETQLALVAAFGDGITPGHREFVAALSDGQFERFAGLKPRARGLMLVPHTRAFDRHFAHCQVPELDREPPPPPPPMPATTQEMLLALESGPASWAMHAAEMLCRDFGTPEDRKLWKALLHVTQAVWNGSFPGRLVADAHRQAMGPKSKNRGAVFNYALQRNGWRESDHAPRREARA